MADLEVVVAVEVGEAEEEEKTILPVLCQGKCVN